MLWTRSLPKGRCILLVSEILLRGSGTKGNCRKNLMANIHAFIILVYITLKSIILHPHLR